MELDRIDVNILELLFKDSRRPFSQIGSELGLKTSQVKSRINQMEKHGVISRYSCLLNPSSLGFNDLVLFQVEAKIIDDHSSNFALTNNLLGLLVDQIPEILFGSVGEDPAIDIPVIYVLMFLRGEQHRRDIIDKINDNPLVDDVKSVNLKSKKSASRLLRMEKDFQKIIIDHLE